MAKWQHYPRLSTSEHEQSALPRIIFLITTILRCLWWSNLFATLSKDVGVANLKPLRCHRNELLWGVRRQTEICLYLYRERNRIFLVQWVHACKAWIEMQNDSTETKAATNQPCDDNVRLAGEMPTFIWRPCNWTLAGSRSWIFCLIQTLKHAFSAWPCPS